MAGLIFYSDHSDFLYLSNKAVSLSYVFTGVALLISFKKFSFAFIHNLANCLVYKRPSFWPILAFNMPSTLSLIIFSF